MKGLVFTELLSMVDGTFGEETTERVVSSCPLASAGIYTAVGTYDAAELKLLVGALSGETGLSVEELQRAYGQRLFGRFHDLYPEMFVRHTNAFAFLAAVGPEIHAEVLKLYPDADLPDITAEKVSEKEIIVHYRSRRDLPSFCQGLVEGCLQHFGLAGLVRIEKADEGLVPSYRLHVSLI